MACHLRLVVNDYGMKVQCQTLNDYLSFATCQLQLKTFSHIMSGMTTKLVIYGVIDLRIVFSVN